MKNKETKILFGCSVLVLIVASLLATFSSLFSFDTICARTQAQANTAKTRPTVPIKTVAQLSMVTIDKVAFLATGATLAANMAGDNASPLYLIISTAQNNTYSAVPLDGTQDLLTVLRTHQVHGVITNTLSVQNAKNLRANGIATYSGVFGQVKDVMPLYQSGKLLAMR